VVASGGLIEQTSALFDGLLPSGLTYRRVGPQRPSRGTEV
jgi:hypothetical protein